MKKRLFAVLASLCMVVSMVPTMAFAQDSDTTIGVSDLCEHHTEHTSDCGYTEETAEMPCGHEHTDECTLSPDSASTLPMMRAAVAWPTRQPAPMCAARIPAASSKH